jgi:hypothetical protein
MTDFSPGIRPVPTATDPASDDSQSAKDKAVEVAQSGKQAVGEVAQTASNAAKDIAHETKRQASDLVGQTRDQLGEQVTVQQSSLVDTLRSLGDQLAAMTDDVQADGTAVDVATKARDKARGAADWLDGREPSEVLDEIRRFGRERPAVFLVGATLAGVVAGRLTRGAVAVHADDSSSGPDHGSAAVSGSTDAKPAPVPSMGTAAPRHDALSAPISAYHPAQPENQPGQSGYQAGRTVTP